MNTYACSFRRCAVTVHAATRADAQAAAARHLQVVYGFRRIRVTDITALLVQATDTRTDDALVIKQCHREPMECPRCGEVTLYPLAQPQPSQLVELECTTCGHYETGAVS